MKKEEKSMKACFYMGEINALKKENDSKTPGVEGEGTIQNPTS